MNYNVLLLTFKHYFHPLPPLVLVLPCKDVFKFGAVTFEMYTFTFNRNALLSLIDNHRLGPESEEKDKWFFFLKDKIFNLSVNFSADWYLSGFLIPSFVTDCSACCFFSCSILHTQRKRGWVSEYFKCRSVNHCRILPFFSCFNSLFIKPVNKQTCVVNITRVKIIF